MSENLMQCGLFRSVAEFKTVVAPVTCQTESEETLLALFHKTPSICGAPSFSDDDSAPRTSFQCDPNHVFLPTLQRGHQGTAGRFATAYCLLYNAIFAFFGKDLRIVAGLGVAEISHNLRRHEEQAPSLNLLQREPRRNTSLDGELVSPSGLFVDSREEQDFAVHREVSSLYSQSPLLSPVMSPTNDVERIRTITRKFASSNDVAFIKLETIEMKVASPTWKEISKVVIDIECGTFAGRSIRRPQIYGVVVNNHLRALHIRSLQFQHNTIETSDFRHVIFIADRNSVAESILFSSRIFNECCEELQRMKSEAIATDH